MQLLTLYLLRFLFKLFTVDTHQVYRLCLSVHWLHQFV